MAHVFEPATSGRAKCRACGAAIAKGEVRFGERIENPFAEGETTIWFHPACAAYKRPESLLEALAAVEEAAPPPGLDRAALERGARATLAHRRIVRIDGAERAPSAQARCRACKEPIEREAWRMRIVYFEQGRFVAGGTVHLTCRRAYLEESLADAELLARLLHFSADLGPEERADLARACETAPPTPGPG
jgi:hypothetical protein